jgi:hypothetical protein
VHTFTFKLLPHSKAVTFVVALFAATASALVGGCGGAPASSTSGTVGATAIAYARSTHALGAGDLAAVDGTYGMGCTLHSGQAWSVSVGDNPASTISVDPADHGGCVLTVTGLDVVGGTFYTASPSITLAMSFSGTASLFTSSGQPSFYANAEMNPVDFTTNVTITVETSDDPDDFPAIQVQATMASESP